MIEVSQNGRRPLDENVAISVENISKKFCRNLRRSLSYGVRDIVSDLCGGRRHSDALRRGEFWALSDVGFQVRYGEAMGLVGSNGAGKSTLLRILSGLIKPDTGCVRVRGRIAPLIALGAGFNPVLSGRENIYANMSILGLSTREIDKRFDEVVDFAEIWEALDAPVQTYSSGMAARLGFACAICVEPDILLIDEVLAVGDVQFRMKCHRRLASLQKQGTAFILVSHNPHSIINICSSALYLQRGKAIAAGEPTDIIRHYEQDLALSGSEDATGKLVLPPKSEAESDGLDILEVAFKNPEGEVLETIAVGDPVHLCLTCRVRKPISDGNLGGVFKAFSGENDRVLYLTSASDNVSLELSPGLQEIRLKLPHCGLVPGVYTVKLYVREGVRSLDMVESFRFTVQAHPERNSSRCLYYQPCEWDTVSAQSVSVLSSASSLEP